MSIQFDSSELTEASGNMTTLAARFSRLAWTYNTSNSSEVRYKGSLPSPYDLESHAVQVSIPIATDGSFTYTNSDFYLIASGNRKFALPEPDTATRAAMTSITEAGDWLEAFIDNMT